jgi:MFS family permease
MLHAPEQSPLAAGSALGILARGFALDKTRGSVDLLLCPASKALMRVARPIWRLCTKGSTFRLMKDDAGSGKNYGWVVVAAITTALTFTSGARLLPGVIMKTVTTEHGWSRSDFMLAITINMVVLSICQPFTGWFADKFGSKTILILGIVLLGISTIPLSFAHELWQFYLFYGVFGAIALALVSPVNITSIVTGWFDQKRGAALAIATSGSAFGQLMIIPAATWLLTATTWPQLYRGLSVILLTIMTPLSLIFIREKKKPENNDSSKPHVAQGPSIGLREALNSSSFWLLAFGFFTCGFTMAFANAHFLAYADDMGMSMTAAADVIAVTALFSIGGSFALGLAADRYPKQLVLSLTYALRGISFVLLWLLPTGNLLYLYAIVLGISWTATTPLTAAISAEIYGRARIGVIFGTMFSFMNLGFGAGSFLDGVVYDSFGSYRIALLVNAGMGGLAAVAVLKAVGRKQTGHPSTTWAPLVLSRPAGD